MHKHSSITTAGNNHVEEPTYLILSAPSPMKTPLHKLLREIPAERLFLIAGSKFFTEEEKDELSPFFNTIVRIKNYRESGNLEIEINKIYQIRPFQKIIAYHELDLLRAARIRDYYQLEGQNYQSALVFRDKILMKNLLIKAGIKVPLFARINSPFDILEFIKMHGFPVVVKPIFGTGTDGVFILRNLAEANEFISKYRGFNDYHMVDLEVETFIKGNTYHVDGYIYNNKIIASWPSVCINQCVDLKAGTYVAHHLLAPPNPMVKRLNDYTKEVLQVLPTPKNTAFLLEVFHEESSDEIIFCEIASRVGGGIREMWSAAFDINLESEFIRIQAGLMPCTNLINFFAGLDASVHLNNISGWIIFPKPLDVLKTIPKTTPFPWVEQYIVRVNPQVLNLPTKNISDSLASAFLVADSEAQFKERANLLNTWLQYELQWEKVSISPDILHCIEACEASIHQIEKFDCEYIKEFIKAQKENIERQKNKYTQANSTVKEEQIPLILHAWQATQLQLEDSTSQELSPATGEILDSNIHLRGYTYTMG